MAIKEKIILQENKNIFEVAKFWFIERSGNIGIILFISLFIIVVSIIKPIFFSFSNILTILRLSSYIALVACGLNLIIACGEIDISVGSTMCITAVTVGFLVHDYGINTWIAILIGLLLGTTIGFINSLIIVKLKLNSVITTLSMMYVLRGIAGVWTHGFEVNYYSPVQAFLGKNTILGLPIPLIICIIPIIIFTFALTKTFFGRRVYSIGSNNIASFLSGLDIQKTKIQVFCISGFMAALSGILLASRLGAASSELGTGYEFDAIAAVIIGGASLYGGSGTVIGAALGAIIISTVRSAVNVLGLEAFWQMIVIGLVVLLAVIADHYSKKYFEKFIRRIKS